MATTADQANNRARESTDAERTEMPAAPARPESSVPYGAPVERAAPRKVSRRRRVPATRLGMAAVVAALVGAWAGIAPFVAPAFGLSPDGTGSWTWNLGHAWLALAPGAAAVLAALIVLANASSLGLARARFAVRLAGLLALASGAWLVVGPVAWPVLEGSRYFVTSDAWGTLIRTLAFSFGPGLVLTAFGAYALGWVGPARIAALNAGHRSAPTGSERTVDPAA
jgi:hypothetical protein